VAVSAAAAAAAEAMWMNGGGKRAVSVASGKHTDTSLSHRVAVLQAAIHATQSS